MLALRLTFPWGRYYAHPWGLNPARLREAEWPPSPWRLLRTLAAGWFRANSGQAPNAGLLSLLDCLGSELPEIAVGPVAFAQTVHWQPNFGAADKDDKLAGIYKRTRHENQFAATSSPVTFRWPNVVLDDARASLLDAILAHISYFGRAESLCVLERIGDGKLPADGWCRPYLLNGKPSRRVAEDCRDLFCPDPHDFRADDLWSRRTGRDRRDPGVAPPHLVEDLLSHQPLPDGVRWISYQMPEGWPGRWVVRVAKSVRKRTQTPPAPRIARYLRFSLQCRIPIPIKFTVPLAEAFRRSALGHFGRANDNAKSFALSGHEPPADVFGDHQQAFYLPLASGKPRLDLIDELHVWCPYGLTQREVEALMRVQRLDWGGGKYPVRPVLLTVADAVPDDPTICVGQVASRVWRSVTPFVPPRYFYRGNLHGGKLKLNDSPEHQLAQCLGNVGIKTACEVRRLTNNGSAQQFLPPMTNWDVVRVPAGAESDRGGMVSAEVHVGSASEMAPSGEKARRVGLFFELTFDSLVALPMPALGHSCHFGLGLFRAVDTQHPQDEGEKHDLARNDHPVARAAARPEDPHSPATRAASGRAEHGLRARAGELEQAGGSTQPPEYATRRIETALGLLTYTELAPHLAERALRLADGIAKGEFAAVPIDEHFIRTLHQRLCGDLVPEFGGRWRDRPVTVGGHEPPPPHAVPAAMRDFALDLNERLRHVEESPERLLEVLAFAEHRLLYIHPFVDFNGRVTRLFLGELLRRLDLPAVDLAPEDSEPRERYFAALRAADARDLSPLKTIWEERLARG